MLLFTVCQTEEFCSLLLDVCAEDDAIGGYLCLCVVFCCNENHEPSGCGCRLNPRL
jgi:hypothetical protein